VSFFSSRRRHTRWPRDWSSDVCSSDLAEEVAFRFDLLLGQHLDQRRRVHGHLVDLLVVDSRRLDEGRPQLEVAAADVERDGLARSEERRVGKEWCLGVAPVCYIGASEV